MTTNENTNEVNAFPDIPMIEAELKRVLYLKRFSRILRSTVAILITVAAVAVLVATLFLPVLRIFGTSMTPTLTEDDIVVSIKGVDLKQGDILSFYYNNRILVQRVIAFPGDWVDIDDAGNLYVNGELLDEPYLSENSKARGECDINLPYQVPDGRIFVCGDHRATSVDSRSTTVGCVAEEQIVGKIVYRVWPIKRFGSI